jgi:hypothetical protein
LGLEPSAALRRLQRSILMASPTPAPTLHSAAGGMGERLSRIS